MILEWGVGLRPRGVSLRSRGVSHFVLEGSLNVLMELAN